MLLKDTPNSTLITSRFATFPTHVRRWRLIGYFPILYNPLFNTGEPHLPRQPDQHVGAHEHVQVLLRPTPALAAAQRFALSAPPHVVSRSQKRMKAPGASLLPQLKSAPAMLVDAFLSA